MSRKQLLKFISLALSIVFTAWLPQGAFGFKLSGGGLGGLHHHLVNYGVNWSIGDASWSADPVARTVSLTVNTATCTFTDLDFDRDGTNVEESADVPCSLNFTFTIPTSGAGGISACTGGVRTYTAYCEAAQFNLPNNGMTGQLTTNPVMPVDPNLSTILSHAGCSGINCTWMLGSLPSVAKGQSVEVDTSKFGCQRAFPATTVELPGSGLVTLPTNQLLEYTETCGSTIVPVSEGARICIGDADAGTVTDCQQIGSGNKTDYHVMFEKNLAYLLTVDRAVQVENGLASSSCPNGGSTKFIVYGQTEFDVNDINLATVTAGVVGTSPYASPVSSSISDTNADGFDDLTLQFHQCDLNGPATAGRTVTVEIIGTATSAGETLTWDALIDVVTK
jgi:hypothetical protein